MQVKVESSLNMHRQRNRNDFVSTTALTRRQTHCKGESSLHLHRHRNKGHFVSTVVCDEIDARASYLSVGTGTRIEMIS